MDFSFDVYIYKFKCLSIVKGGLCRFCLLSGNLRLEGLNALQHVPEWGNSRKNALFSNPRVFSGNGQAWEILRDSQKVQTMHKAFYFSK